MLYLLTVENCPTHDKKKIEQSGCSVLLSNHYYIILVFMINCKTIFLYMNLSSSLFNMDFWIWREEKFSFPALKKPQLGEFFCLEKELWNNQSKWGWASRGAWCSREVLLTAGLVTFVVLWYYLGNTSLSSCFPDGPSLETFLEHVPTSLPYLGAPNTSQLHSSAPWLQPFLVFWSPLQRNNCFAPAKSRHPVKERRFLADIAI